MSLLVTSLKKQANLQSLSDKQKEVSKDRKQGVISKDQLLSAKPLVLSDIKKPTVTSSFPEASEVETVTETETITEETPASKKDNTKYYVIGAGVIVLIGIGYFAFRKK